MRKFALIFCACVILCLLVGMYPVSTQASEAVDAELSDMFYQFTYGGEEYSEGRMYELCKRFFADPTIFVRQLALESEEIQKDVLERLPLGVYHNVYPHGGQTEFPKAVYSIRLTAEDSEETRNMLSALKAEVVKHWGDSIPKTGDPIDVAVLLMAASGLGLAALLKLRKRPS